MNEHLIITLDAASGISLQAQIRQSVVEAILGHSILPGDKLPSSRALAKQLKVSRNTVILAYQALVDIGYLRPRERSGYVVSDEAPITVLLIPQAIVRIGEDITQLIIKIHYSIPRKATSIGIRNCGLIVTSACAGQLGNILFLCLWAG